MEKHYKTKSGLDIYSYELEKLNRFCISLNIKAGLLYEDENETGITHYLEHVLFRRMGKYTINQLNAKLDKYGLYFNGTTYRKFLRFELTGCIDYFEKGVDIFLNLFEPFTVTQEEADKELKRISREICEDGFKSTTEYQCTKIVWEGTPLARSVLGEEWRLKRIRINKLREKKEKLFSKENIFIYVTGAIGGKLDYLHKKAGDVIIGQSDVRQNIAPVPRDFARRDIKTIIHSSDSNHIGVSFDIDFSRINKKDIELLSIVLFSLSNNRVIKDLSDEQGLIYDYNDFLEYYDNIGRLYFKIETEENMMFESLAAIMKMFRDIKSGISDLEFDSAVVWAIADIDLNLDNAENVNMDYSWDSHLLGYGFKTAEEKRQQCRSIKKADVEAAAREIFTPKNLCIAFLSTVRLDKTKIRQVVLENLM